MDDDKKKYKVPSGTIAILTIYIVLIILLWGTAYLTLLSPGVTG